MKRDIVHILLESPDFFVLQKRDDRQGVLYGGKNSAWGGMMEDTDGTPVDGAMRELTEETSLKPRKKDLTKVCVTSYKGVMANGKQLEHTFHVFHLDIDDYNFDVFEGEGVYLMPKNADPTEHNLTPSTNLILALYLETIK